MIEQHKLANSNELKQLAILQPWRAIITIAFDWALISLAILASLYCSNLIVYLLAVIVISGRMHAFGVLMHEAAHMRLVKSRTMNNWIGDLFLAWPLFIRVDGYRQNHLKHHSYTNTDQDPDWIVKKGLTYNNCAW